jgi:hypothetical protein
MTFYPVLFFNIRFHCVFMELLRRVKRLNYRVYFRYLYLTCYKISCIILSGLKDFNTQLSNWTN